MKEGTWVSYSEGDKLPDNAFYFWVVLKPSQWSSEQPKLAEKSDGGFYTIDLGGISDLVSCYIPIATPTPPKR